MGYCNRLLDKEWCIEHANDPDLYFQAPKQMLINSGFPGAFIIASHREQDLVGNIRKRRIDDPQPAKVAAYPFMAKLAAEGRIGRLTLNQPRNLNPLGNDTLRELAEAATWFDSTDVPIVVVTGEGRAFTAGFDLRQFGDKDGAGAQLGRAMAEAASIRWSLEMSTGT